MESFEYKIFTVTYKQILQDTYLYTLISEDGRKLNSDYVVSSKTGNIKGLIIDELDKIFRKHSIGFFRYELYFDENWDINVSIWLVNGEVISETLVSKEKSLTNLVKKIKTMLEKPIVYKGYNVFNFHTIGYNMQQKNVCAIKLINGGNFDILYDEDLDGISIQINKIIG